MTVKYKFVSMLDFSWAPTSFDTQYDLVLNGFCHCFECDVWDMSFNCQHIEIAIDFSGTLI